MFLQNYGIDYQSDIDKLKYLNISSFVSLTTLFIIILIPYFYNKMKSIYFLLIFFLFNTGILIINIFISKIYSRIEDTLKIYVLIYYYFFHPYKNWVFLLKLFLQNQLFNI